MKTRFRNENFFPKSLHAIAALLSISCFFGCTSGYRALPQDPPAAALENAIQQQGNEALFDLTDSLPQDWWTIFEDEQLTSFIEMALKRNPTIQSAHASSLRAAYIAQNVRSVLFPNILWGGDISRQKFSETGIIPFRTTPQISNTPLAATGGVNGIPVYFTQWETEFTLTFDLDLWGKNRNTWKAALNEVQAKLADEAFLRLSISTDVAKTYFQLQTDYQRQQLAKEYVDNRTAYLNYIERRISANLDNALSLNNAQFLQSNSKQGLLQIEGEIAVNEYRLKALLAGDFEEEIAFSPIIHKPLPKVPIPTDLPLHLIARRPDIIAQLWLIASAGKQIAVAQAGFYPDVNLTALFGYQTIHLHELFHWPSSFFNVDPAISLPIFDGGRLISNLRRSEVNYDQAIFDYNQKVITAAEQVLESIAVLKNADLRLQEYRLATEYSANVHQITQNRVSGNLNSSLDTINSEGNVLLAQAQEIVATGTKIQGMLSLIKALGGGYDGDCP